VDASADLRGKHLESLNPEQAGGPLLRLRYGWRNRQVEASVQGHCFVDDPQLTFKLLKLTAHPVEAALQCGFVNGALAR
jgi:hypothetical protein